MILRNDHKLKNIYFKIMILHLSNFNQLYFDFFLLFLSFRCYNLLINLNLAHDFFVIEND